MPDVLEKINLHYYPSLRISISDRFRTPLARESLYYVEHYLNGLILQWNRIADDLAQSFRSLEIDDTPARVAIQSQVEDHTDYDVHFLLICWARIQKFLKLFEREQTDETVSEVCSSIKDLLDRGANARHYVEHLDGRLTSGGGKTRSRSAGGGVSLSVSYEVVAGSGSIERRTDSFGREEIRRIAAAYS